MYLALIRLTLKPNKDRLLNNWKQLMNNQKYPNNIKGENKAKKGIRHFQLLIMFELYIISVKASTIRNIL